MTRRITFTLQPTQESHFIIGSFYAPFRAYWVQQKIENPLSSMLLTLTVPALKKIFYGAIK